MAVTRHPERTGQQQRGHDTERRKGGEQRRPDREGALPGIADGIAAEAIHRDYKNTHDHRPEAVEHILGRRQRAVFGVRRRERQHDGKGRHDETESGQHPAPPAGTHIADVDAELGRTGAREHIHQRQPFQESLLRQPGALFLELGLHEPHDGRAAVTHGTDLEKATCHLTPACCKRFITHDRLLVRWNDVNPL